MMASSENGEKSQLKRDMMRKLIKTVGKDQFLQQAWNLELRKGDGQTTNNLQTLLDYNLDTPTAFFLKKTHIIKFNCKCNSS